MLARVNSSFTFAGIAGKAWPSSCSASGVGNSADHEGDGGDKGACQAGRFDHQADPGGCSAMESTVPKVNIPCTTHCPTRFHAQGSIFFSISSQVLPCHKLGHLLTDTHSRHMRCFQGRSAQIALKSACMYLAHHELEKNYYLLLFYFVIINILYY